MDPETVEYIIDYTPYLETLHDDLTVLESDYQQFSVKYAEDVKQIISAQQLQIQCLNSQIEQQNTMIQGLGFLVGEFLILLIGIILYKLLSSIERA